MIKKLINAYQTAYADLPPQIWMLSAALFVNRLGTMVLPFLALYLTKSEGFSDAQAGYLISIYGLGSVVGSYLGGRLTDRVGAIRLQVLFLLLSSPIFIVLPFCQSFTHLAIAIFSLSVFSEGVRPANATAITEFSSPQQRTRAFALYRMAINLGISFGPAIGGLLIALDFIWIFVVDASTTAVCAILLLRFFGLHRGDAEETNEEPVDDCENLKSPLRDGTYLVYLFLTFLGATVFFQFFTTYPLYLSQHYGLSEFEIGLIYAVNTVLIVLFEMLLVNRAKNWNLILCVGWGTLLQCLGFGILPLSNATWFCVLSMVILTVGEMLGSPMSSSWVSQRSENRNTGAYMGWYTMAYSLAFIAGPAIGGSIYEFDSTLLFSLCSAVGAFVFCGFAALNAWTKKMNTFSADP